MNLSLNKRPNDPASIGDIIAAFKQIPPQITTTDKIIFGTPDKRPLPFKYNGYLFVDYITPVIYFSVGTSWVDMTSGSSGGGMVLDATPPETPDGIITVFTVADDFSSIVIWYATDSTATLMRLTNTYYSQTGTNEFTLTFAPITGSILRCDYIKA